jgi:hypothetical protein
MHPLATPSSPKLEQGFSTVRGNLRKAFSFPALLGVMVVASACGGVYFKLQELSNLPSGQPHISIIEGDTWLHILMGEDLLRTRHWPTTDSYSFTAHGNPSMAYEWLGEVGLALINRTAGLRGLTISLMALAAILLLLVYYYAWLGCGNSKAAFVACMLVSPLASVLFTLRPQLLGYIFLALTLIVLEHFRQGRTKVQKRSLWVLPVLFVIWVNTHGSFVLGLVALGIYWASGQVAFEAGGIKAQRWNEAESRQLALVFLLCVAGLAVTPYGTDVVGFTLHYLLDEPLTMAHIGEYQPLGVFGIPFRIFLVLVLAFLLAQVVLRPPYRLDEMVLLLGGIYGAAVHVRLLLFLVLVVAPPLARLLALWVPAYEAGKDRHLLNAVLMGLVGLGLVKFFPSPPELEKVIECAFPRGSVDYLRRHPVSGRMFNPDIWGAYLIHSLGHEHKVFIDGRSQLYEEAGVFGDYLRITAVDRDTLMLLQKYGVEACLIERDSALATLLRALPDWQEVYTDKLSVLLVRRSIGEHPGSRQIPRPLGAASRPHFTRLRTDMPRIRLV